jgi:8-oxo-dGTP diphosphatase
MESSRFGTVEEAVHHAEANGYRQRAMCYVTRGPNELLVFEQHVSTNDASTNDAGVQLPAGGLEQGETPAQAAAREALEETGLAGLSLPVYIGSCLWNRLDVGAPQIWHYFQLTAPEASPVAWTHTVTDGVFDSGLLFHLRFVPLHSPPLTPNFGSHEYLPELVQLLQES